MSSIRPSLPLSLVVTLLTSSTVFAQAAGQKICEINANGTGFRDLYVVPGNVSVGSPTVSSDGTTLAFEATIYSSSRGRFVESGQRQTVVMTVPTSDLPVTAKDTLGFRIDGRGQPRTFPNIGFGVMPSWSPGGNRLVCSMVGQRAVFVMRKDGTEATNLHPQGWAAKWSPDGRMIAFVNQRNGNRLTVYDLVEDEEFAIGSSSYRNIRAGFDWSPDSRSIAFCATTRTGQYEIARVNVLERGQHEVLRRGVPALRLSWHPDGSRLLYSDVRKRPQRLVTIPTRGEQAQPQAVAGIPSNLSADIATWSPDGKKIIFVGTLNR